MKISFNSQADFTTTHRVDNINISVNVEDKKVTLDFNPNPKEIDRKQLFKNKILEIIESHPRYINTEGIDKEKLVNSFIPSLMWAKDIIDFNDTEFEEIFDEIDDRLKKLLNYYFLKTKKKRKNYRYENNI